MRLAACMPAILAAWLVYAPVVEAHLLPVGNGTLNFVDDGAYLVLAIPVSVFLSAADANDDGALSAKEFSAHAEAITQKVLQGVVLRDRRGDALPLEGLMLSLSDHDHGGASDAAGVLALGRFDTGQERSRFSLEISLDEIRRTSPDFRVRARRADETRRIALTDGKKKQLEFSSDASL